MQKNELLKRQNKNFEDENLGLRVSLVLWGSLLASSFLVNWHFLTAGLAAMVANKEKAVVAAHRDEKDMSRRRRAYMQAFNRARQARALTPEMK